MQIVPPRFCHIDTKMSVLWPSKYAKIRFQPGICPGPRWGAHDAPPDPFVGWRGDTPPHIPPNSARTHLRRSPYGPPRSPARSTPLLTTLQVFWLYKLRCGRAPAYTHFWCNQSPGTCLVAADVIILLNKIIYNEELSYRRDGASRITPFKVV